MKTTFYISNDKSLLDTEMIYNFLSNESYWAKGSSYNTIMTSIEHSLCFGVYQNNKQVGFARVVSDFAVIAWVMDLFILKEYRGHGLGKMLMEAIMNHESLQGLRRWGLATEDAHGLYRQFGFSPLKNPNNLMEIVQPPS